MILRLVTFSQPGRYDQGSSVVTFSRLALEYFV